MIVPPPATQLWAAPADFEELGLPFEVLSSRPGAQKEHALRAASGLLATYLRGRYTLPLGVTIEAFTTSGMGSASVALIGSPAEAASLLVEVLDPGGAVGGVVPIRWSRDGGLSFDDGDAGELAVNGVFGWAGVELHFAGALPEGAKVRVLAGADWGLRQHVVNVAAHSLVYNRGVDGASADGQGIRQRYEDALAWAREIQGEKAKLDEGRDATAGRRDTRGRGGGQQNAWDFLDEARPRLRRRGW